MSSFTGAYYLCEFIYKSNGLLFLLQLATKNSPYLNMLFEQYGVGWEQRVPIMSRGCHCLPTSEERKRLRKQRRMDACNPSPIPEMTSAQLNELLYMDSQNRRMANKIQRTFRTAHEKHDRLVEKLEAAHTRIGSLQHYYNQN